MNISRLLIASNNRDKSNELAVLLRPYNIEVLSAAQFPFKDPEETGSTFIENAELKARYYGELTQLPSLADDSGLCVEALGGEPGVYSGRFAGQSRDFTMAFDKIKKLLEDKDLSTSKAFFNCVLSLWLPGGEIMNFEGKVDGVLVFPARGEYKFGYDPIFIPDGYNQTFAEMDRELKNQISHRSKAFHKFISTCF